MGGAAPGVVAVLRTLPGFFTAPGVLAGPGALLDFFLGFFLVLAEMVRGEGRKRGSSISKTGVTTDFLRFFEDVSAFNCILTFGVE